MGQHCPGVPGEVPVPALAVAPARAPRYAGDDERRRSGSGRRADLHEGVLDRPVGVDAGRCARRPFRKHGVDLQREPPTSRACGSEEDLPARPARPTLGADDAGREVEQPRELGEVERGTCARSAAEHGQHAPLGCGQLPRQRDDWQLVRELLDERRQPVHVARLERGDDPRIVDGVPNRPAGSLAQRRHGREPVEQPRHVAVAHAADYLPPARCGVRAGCALRLEHGREAEAREDLRRDEGGDLLDPRALERQHVER